MAEDLKKPTAQQVYDATMSGINANRTGLGRIAFPTYETQEVTPAKRATTYEDLYKMYNDTPMTKEEEERRKRAATQVSAVGHFGNAMNAFSNLIFTGMGAPSQTLPTVQNPDLQAFSDKAREARRLYANGVAQGRQMDDADYNRQLDREMQQRKERNNTEQQKFNNALTIAQQQGKLNDAEAAAMANWYKNATEEERVKFNQDMQKQQLSLSWANHNLSKQRLAQADRRMEMQDNQRRMQIAAKYGDGDPNSIVFDDSDSPYKMKKNNDLASLANIYQIVEDYGLAEEGLTSRMPTSALNPQDAKKVAGRYQDAIGKAIRKDTSHKLRDALMRAGYITPIAVGSEQQQGLGWGTNTGKTENNNTETDW